MKQHNSAVIKKDAAQFEKWCFQQTVELEHTRRELENSKREMERHQRELEFQKRKFEMEKNLEQERVNFRNLLPKSRKWSVRETFTAEYMNLNRRIEANHPMW